MRLERFGTLSLSMIDAADELDTGQASVGLIDTVAGEYDSDGANDARMRGRTLTRTFGLHGATTDDLDDARDAVRALVGQRARLYARMGDESVRWVNARLLGVQERRTRRNFNFQSVTCQFQLVDPTWQGADHSTWVLDDGEILDGGLYLDDGGETFTGSSPHIFTVTNGGNRVVTNPVITVTAGGANITSVTITKTGTGGSETKIVWTDAGTTGALATTKSLVIDCGKFTITDDGANAYSGKTAFDSNHTIAEWLRIDPGYNEVTITWVGGSTDSTVTLEFRDGWA
jgi:hypothetical protein